MEAIAEPPAFTRNPVPHQTIEPAETAAPVQPQTVQDIEPPPVQDKPSNVPALTKAERLAAGKEYMRHLQSLSAKARWAKYSPEARSAAMSRIASRRHPSTRKRMKSANLSRTALRAIQREIQPTWKPALLLKLRRELRMRQENLAIVMSTARQTIDRWERGIQVPSRSTQRLVWLLSRSLHGQPIDLASLITSGRSDAYARPRRPSRSSTKPSTGGTVQTSLSGTFTTVHHPGSAQVP